MQDRASATRQDAGQGVSHKARCRTGRQPKGKMQDSAPAIRQDAGQSVSQKARCRTMHGGADEGRGHGVLMQECMSSHFGIARSRTALWIEAGSRTHSLCSTHSAADKTRRATGYSPSDMAQQPPMRSRNTAPSSGTSAGAAAAGAGAAAGSTLLPFFRLRSLTCTVHAWGVNSSYSSYSHHSYPIAHTGPPEVKRMLTCFSSSAFSHSW